MVLRSAIACGEEWQGMPACAINLHRLACLDIRLHLEPTYLAPARYVAVAIPGGQTLCLVCQGRAARKRGCRRVMPVFASPCSHSTCLNRISVGAPTLTSSALGGWQRCNTLFLSLL